MTPRERSLANLKPVKKGDPPRNPTGKCSVELMAVRRLTRQHISEIATLLMKATPEELNHYCQGKGVPMISRMIARVLRKAGTWGDHKAMMALLETVAGKHAQEVVVAQSPHAALVGLVNKAEEDEEFSEDDMDDDFLGEGQ